MQKLASAQAGYKHAWQTHGSESVALHKEKRDREGKK